MSIKLLVLFLFCMCVFMVLVVFIIKTAVLLNIFIFLFGIGCIILGQIIAFSFVYKLYKLHNVTEISKFDDKLIGVMTKYALLSVISVSGTCLYIVSLFFKAQSKWMVLIYVIGLDMDVLLDAICMSLSSTWNDKYYKIFCICLDSKCRKWFEGHEVNIQNIQNIEHNIQMGTIQTESVQSASVENTST
eukprot:186996_1